MNNGDISEILADGGFGRRLGSYYNTPILYGTKQESNEFCVAIYWNDSEADEGIQIATVVDILTRLKSGESHVGNLRFPTDTILSGVSTIHGYIGSWQCQTAVTPTFRKKIRSYLFHRA